MDHFQGDPQNKFSTVMVLIKPVRAGVCKNRYIYNYKQLPYLEMVLVLNVCLSMDNNCRGLQSILLI